MGDRYSTTPEIFVSWTADCVRVCLSGEVDLSNADFVRNYLEFVLDQGEMRVIVDLTRLELIDSVGLRALVPAAQRARSAGGGVVLVGVAPLTLTVLQHVPLARHVTVVERDDSPNELQYN